MKLYTPDNAELIDVTAIKPHVEGIQIEGTIMGAMPMKAIMRPRDLRSGFRFVSPGLIWSVFTMLFRKS